MEQRRLITGDQHDVADEDVLRDKVAEIRVLAAAGDGGGDVFMGQLGRDDRRRRWTGPASIHEEQKYSVKCKLHEYFQIPKFDCICRTVVDQPILYTENRLDHKFKLNYSPSKLTKNDEKRNSNTIKGIQVWSSPLKFTSNWTAPLSKPDTWEWWSADWWYPRPHGSSASCRCYSRWNVAECHFPRLRMTSWYACDCPLGWWRKTGRTTRWTRMRERAWGWKND